MGVAAWDHVHETNKTRLDQDRDERLGHRRAGRAEELPDADLQRDQGLVRASTSFPSASSSTLPDLAMVIGLASTRRDGLQT